MNKAIPKISIATIVYNDLRGIKSTIASVAGQDYTNIEFIVVDGSSSDGTLDYIESNKDNIDIVLSEPDDGIYHAMNKAIKIATGDWIIFMNSGDAFYSFDTVTSCASLMEEEGKVYFGRAKIIVDPNTSWVYPDTYINTSNIKKWIKKSLPNHQAMFFPKEFYSKNTFNLSFSISSDSDYKLRSIQSCGYVFMDMIICNFLHGGISSNMTISSLYKQCIDRLKRKSGQGGYYFTLECISKSLIKFFLSNIMSKKHKYRILEIRRSINAKLYK